VIRKVTAWYDEARIESDFTSFVASIKTFYDLVIEGTNFYTLEEYGKAASSFSKALELEPQNYIPYYYLGLISYAKREYIQAEGYYRSSLALGAEDSLTNYALGVNAFADNRFDQASTYLTQAKRQNPDRYADKVDSLMQRIETLR
jgi:tetratricopeptide (TPR) repeat protein